MLRTVKKRIDSWLFSKDGASFCESFNRLNRVYWKYPITLSWNRAYQKILVDDGSKRLFIARPRRARRYERGITAKLDSLANEYLLRRIDFRPGDWIIDCGANVGEVGMWLSNLAIPLNIVCIEPEVSEAECCDLNVYGGERRTICSALWYEHAQTTLYSKNDTGDSSVFETRGYKSSVTIQTTTLSELFEENHLSHVKLLKLEAEGAEPEVLLGGERHLHRIEYIAADLGPERGVKEESTAAPVVNFLLERDFKLVDVSSDRIVCLFRNRRSDSNGVADSSGALCRQGVAH